MLIGDIADVTGTIELPAAVEDGDVLTIEYREGPLGPADTGVVGPAHPDSSSRYSEDPATDRSPWNSDGSGPPIAGGSFLPETL